MDYISVLHQTIAELVQRFQRNPFDFLYERDLQAMLFALLVEGFGSETIVMKGGWRDATEYGDSDTVSTVPVKSEYPASSRFDVAIIDPEALRTYDEALWRAEGLKSDAFWNQPVLAAVELKYCQLGDRQELRRAGCDSDIDKLRRYLEERGERPFLGISLLFIQSASLDPTIFFDGTELRENPKSGLARYVVSKRGWWRGSV